MDRLVALVLLALSLAKPVLAQAEVGPLEPYISDASARFGIPQNWVRAVIMAESGGDTKAVSSKGAMGLMQLMPGTWEELRSAHMLASDPFDPHANILAGTAHLKAMYDRFGYPALFAAYNAGEGRYDDYLQTGKPLPDETRAYVADLGRKLGFEERFTRKAGSKTQLFFALSTAEGVGQKAVNSASPGNLFIRISGGTLSEK